MLVSAEDQTRTESTDSKRGFRRNRHNFHYLSACDRG